MYTTAWTRCGRVAVEKVAWAMQEVRARGWEKVEQCTSNCRGQHMEHLPRISEHREAHRQDEAENRSRKRTGPCTRAKKARFFKSVLFS